MSFVMVEFLCPADGRFESLESRPAPTSAPCPICSAPSELVISAPLGTTPIVTVERGALAKPPGPGFLDTSGYGLRKQSYTEWKAAQQKKQADLRRAEIKAKLR